jgi:prophage regulatory protein
LDASKPFDDSLPPSHWIFFDIDDFNEILEASCDEAARPRPRPPADVAAPPPERDIRSFQPFGDNHVRLPEVERRTGMSRATIYRRIAEGRFPEQISMAGNIAAWRESELAEWLANPR